MQYTKKENIFTHGHQARMVTRSLIIKVLKVNSPLNLYTYASIILLGCWTMLTMSTMITFGYV
jgi:hypothetical protein